VRAGRAQLGVVVWPRGDADGEGVGIVRRVHVSGSVADVGVRVVVAQCLGLAGSVPPAEHRVDREADVIQAPMRVRLVLRRHHQGARAGLAHELEGLGRARKEIGSGYAERHVEVAEALGELVGALGREPIGELEVEVAAEQRVEERRVGQRGFTGLRRERIDAGLDAGARVDQRHVEVEADDELPAPG